MPYSFTRYWFSIRGKSIRDITYLVFAEDMAKAGELFGTLSKGSEVKKMTWSDMAELTGCIVPMGFSSDDFVTMYPIFSHKGRSYSLVYS